MHACQPDSLVIVTRTQHGSRATNDMVQVMQLVQINMANAFLCYCPESSGEPHCRLEEMLHEPGSSQTTSKWTSHVISYGLSCRHRHYRGACSTITSACMKHIRFEPELSSLVSWLLLLKVSHKLPVAVGRVGRPGATSIVIGCQLRLLQGHSRSFIHDSTPLAPVPADRERY